MAARADKPQTKYRKELLYEYVKSAGKPVTANELQAYIQTKGVDINRNNVTGLLRRDSRFTKVTQKDKGIPGGMPAWGLYEWNQ